MNDLIIQGIGFIGALFIIYAFSISDDRKLINFSALGSFLFSVHYLMLGSELTALLVFIGSLRIFITQFYKSKKLMWFFIALSAAPVTLVTESWQVIVPAASVLATYVYFSFNGIKMRTGLILCTSLFLINDLILGSWSGIATNVFAIFSALYSISKSKKEIEKAIPA